MYKINFFRTCRYKTYIFCSLLETIYIQNIILNLLIIYTNIQLALFIVLYSRIIIYNKLTRTYNTIIQIYFSMRKILYSKTDVIKIYKRYINSFMKNIFQTFQPFEIKIVFYNFNRYTYYVLYNTGKYA